jgi:RNA polymerase sigma-70 factor (ECF subfamily)
VSTPFVARPLLGIVATVKEKVPAERATEPAESPRALVERLSDRALAERAARDERKKDEGVLVEQAKTGDARAFRTLVERNQGRLFAVAFGMLKDRDDAMDVVQDAFIKAHKKLVDFEGNAAFGTWLYRICVNLCIDKKRSDARRRSVALDDARAIDVSDEKEPPLPGVGPRSSGTNPARNLHDKELGSEIDRGLARLSSEHRAVLLLREVEGMSYEEIAETLEIPKGTVMSRLFHARKNLQRQLRPYLGLKDGEGLPGGSGEADGEDETES